MIWCSQPSKQNSVYADDRMLLLSGVQMLYDYSGRSLFSSGTSSAGGGTHRTVSHAHQPAYRGEIGSQSANASVMMGESDYRQAERRREFSQQTAQ